MPDNSFTIGATVDVAQVQAGMTAASEVTQESLDKMLVSFQEASTGAARAVSRISDDTRAAALEVDASWKEVAQATLAYNSALKEVSAATYLARKAGADDAAAVGLLAAAKEKAAVASAALSAAQLEAAGANEIEALSLKELSAITSETFEKMTTGFLGIGIVGGIFGHLESEAADFAIQMRNLSLTTGIAAPTLGGLHDVVKEMGGDFDAVSTGLSKMLKAQEAAVTGSAKQIEGFKMVGLSVNELKTLTPEELLFRVAEGFQTVGSSAEKNTAAVDIFGKGGRALIPVFAALGDSFREEVEEAGKVSGISKENEEAALRWHAQTEKLSVAMRAFASETLPYVLKGIGGIVAAFEGAAAAVVTLLDAIGGVLVTVFQGIEGAGKLIYDATTGNFGALEAVARAIGGKVSDTWKGVAKDVSVSWATVKNDFNSITGDAKVPTVPKGASGEDLPGTGGKDTRLADWRSELQAKKDDEDGFHELSKDDEAAFWQAKLATVEAGTKLYAEVLHELRAAERASDKESLKNEQDAVRERLAATKQGSAERVAILQEEVSHLKAIGADQTEDFKRLQTQLVAATREYADQQGKAAVETERQKVDATRKGSEERVAAEQAVLNRLAALGLQQTAEYTKQQQRVTDATRQASQERLKLQELDIEQAKIVGLSKTGIERQNVQADYDLHRISAQQRIAALRALEDEEYEITKGALQKKLVLMEQDPTLSPVQIRQLQNQIENLTREHNNKLAQLDTQSVKESMQRFDQFFQHISQGFQTAINGMLTGTKSFAKGMQDMWNSLVTSFVQSLAKMAVSWLQHEVAKLVIHTTTNEGIVASDTAAATQSQSISLISSLKQIAHSAAAAAAKAYEAMAGIPVIGPVLGAVAAAATFTAVMAFGSLASAKDGMVSGEEQLAFIHKNEMVLPASLSLGFQRLLGGGSGAAAPAAFGGGSGSNVSFGDINYSPTYHGTHSPAQDPSVIAKMTRRKIARSVGLSL